MKLLGIATVGFGILTMSPIYGWAIGYDFCHLDKGDFRGFVLFMMSVGITLCGCGILASVEFTK